MSSPEIIDLFHTLQEAARLVEGGASRLGLVDLVTVGQVSCGLMCNLNPCGFGTALCTEAKSADVQSQVL